MGDDKIPLTEPEAGARELSPRQKGVRQGVILMLLSIILIPAYIFLAALFPAHDRLVESSVSDTPFEKISQAILFTIFMAGLARMLYAYVFQEGSGVRPSKQQAEQLRASANHALRVTEGMPISGFGKWLGDVDEIAEPLKVKEQRDVLR